MYPYILHAFLFILVQSIICPLFLSAVVSDGIRDCLLLEVVASLWEFRASHICTVSIKFPNRFIYLCLLICLHGRIQSYVQSKVQNFEVYCYSEHGVCKNQFSILVRQKYKHRMICKREYSWNENIEQSTRKAHSREISGIKKPTRLLYTCQMGIRIYDF